MIVSNKKSECIQTVLFTQACTFFFLQRPRSSEAWLLIFSTDNDKHDLSRKKKLTSTFGPLDAWNDSCHLCWTSCLLAVHRSRWRLYTSAFSSMLFDGSTEFHSGFACVCGVSGGFRGCVSPESLFFCWSSPLRASALPTDREQRRLPGPEVLCDTSWRLLVFVAPLLTSCCPPAHMRLAVQDLTGQPSLGHSDHIAEPAQLVLSQYFCSCFFLFFPIYWTSLLFSCVLTISRIALSNTVLWLS